MVIVYNPASKPSFEALQALYDEVMVARAGLDPIPISIVACHSSPGALGDVAREDGEKFAREHKGSTFAEVSLHSHNVAEAFENILHQSLERNR